MKSSYDSTSGIYSYKKDGQWFFSVCPPDQVTSKRVDGKWYFVELCVGGGGGGSDVSKIYVDSQDQKLQANIDKCFADSKDYADSIVADYALVSYVDEQIAAIEIPEGQDFALYALKTEVEAGDASTLGDAKKYTDSQDADLQTQIDSLSSSGGYNDAWIQPAIDSGDATSLADAKAYTDQEVAAIPLSDYATKTESTEDDVKALEDSKKYTDEKVSAIVFPPGTVVKDTEPQNVRNGTNWFDTVRLELFVRASDSWLPSSPLGARVSQGEIVQAQILERIEGLATTEYVDGADEAVLNAAKKYTDESQGPEVATNVMVTEGDQDVESGWKLMSGGRTLISVGSTQVGLYHVKDPTDDAHPVTRGFADARYQFIQKPIGFKIDQSATCSLNPVPSSGEFCGLNNSSPGSSTSPNNFFGNFNAGIRVHADKLLNPEGNKFEIMERYSIAGTVSILGKDTGKLYFRHGITAVVRDSSHEYVELIFATRIPTFGTGSIDAEAKYIVIVDGLESVRPATANIPEETE